MIKLHRHRGIGGGLASVKRFIASTDRLPYRWGAAGPVGVRLLHAGTHSGCRAEWAKAH
jgi:hypothetical protein